jgi:WD40 repeat protein
MFYRPDRSLTITPGQLLKTSKKQDRGILCMHYNRAHHLLISLSWDNVMRLYDTRSDADPLCISNENSALFTGIDYDPEHQQVRACSLNCLLLRFYDPTLSMTLPCRYVACGCPGFCFACVMQSMIHACDFYRFPRIFQSCK